MTERLADLLDGQQSPVTDADAARWRRSGMWPERSLRSVLTTAAASRPERTALVGYRSGAEPVRVSYREYDAAARHLAAVLDHLGVGRGDTVALMLPNWIEYPEFVFAINEIGAVYAGVPVAFGDRETTAILRRSKAKVLVIPRRFRRSEHLQMSRRLRTGLPHLQHVLVLDDDTADLMEGESLLAQYAHLPATTFPAPVPGRICYLGFTSGTTGEPKGAMHSHNTLLHAVGSLADHIGTAAFGDPMVNLVASPVGHHTGFTYGILMTTYLAGTGVYLDRWDPQLGGELIKNEGVTAFFGAPTFLQDLLRSDLAGAPDCPLRCIVIAGAPVPRNLPEQAGNALGAYVASAWGLTESSIVSSATPAEPDAIQQTDGSILASSEVKVVDEAGHELPTGTTGDLLTRGPGVMLGYFDRPDATADAFLPGLWFRTGDTASVDEHGWLSLRGRRKDIVIRGGENVPVTEVESLIFDNPAVLNVAVVGVPDERLGERICAVVVTSGDAFFTVDTLAEYLVGRGMSKQYLPEIVVMVDHLPLTASGKIQKFKIREQVIDRLGSHPAEGQLP
jgi:cyclohexanecarboxylate-CoA ligase